MSPRYSSSRSSSSCCCSAAQTSSSHAAAMYDTRASCETRDDQVGGEDEEVALGCGIWLDEVQGEHEDPEEAEGHAVAHSPPSGLLSKGPERQGTNSPSVTHSQGAADGRRAMITERAQGGCPQSSSHRCKEAAQSHIHKVAILSPPEKMSM